MLSRNHCFPLIFLSAVGFGYYLSLHTSIELASNKFENKVQIAKHFCSKPKYNFSKYLGHSKPNGDPYFQRVAELKDFAYVLSAFFNDKS